MPRRRGERLTIQIELDIEVLDLERLRAAAIARIDAVNLIAPDGEDVEAIKDEERTLIRDGDATDAVDALIDPYDLVPDESGIECSGSSHSTVSAEERPVEPDFPALFDVCRCAKDEACPRCSSFQLTPPTARALWRVARLMSDQGYDDVESFGDDPVTADGIWAVFDRYPRITHEQDAVWRRQAARSFDDLAGDLAGGTWPRPTCPGEEMAVHLMLELAEAAVQDGWWGECLDGVPVHRDDFNWDLAGEVFVQDTDILRLFDAGLDGLDDPDDATNASLRMGDHRPGAWFTPFDNAQPRDGRRPFRR